MNREFKPGDRVTVTWPGGEQEAGVLERAESWTVTLPDGSCEVAETRALAASPRPAATEGEAASGDAIARELRGWADDIDNECWSLVALPRVLRERADEFAASTPSTAATEGDVIRLAATPREQGTAEDAGDA